MCTVSWQKTIVAGFTTSVVALSLLPLQAQSGKNATDALKVAELLDRIIQPRFQQDAGVFGTGRVSTVIGHNFVADFKFNGRPKTEPLTVEEAALLHKAISYNHDYIISFLHMAHVPGHHRFKDNDRPGYAESNPHLNALGVRDINRNVSQTANGEVDIYQQTRTMQYVAVEHLAQLRAGKAITTGIGQWVLVMRPVRALKPSCLGCHTGAKQGDTLGVMV